MSALLVRYADTFPILERGTTGREYKFDPESVTAFLRDREAERIAAGAERDDLIAQFTIPGIDPPAATGLKPSDQLALARAAILQRQQAKEAGFLVETAQVRAALTRALTRLRRDEATAIRQILRDANTAEPTIRSVESRFAEAQRRAVADIQEALRSNAPHEPEPALL